MISDLVKRFNIKYEKILKHSEIVNTSCPGKNFPFEELKKKVVSNVNDEWKKDSLIFAEKRGWIKSEDKYDEGIDMGTFLTVLKNFYDLEIANLKWHFWCQVLNFTYKLIKCIITRTNIVFIV